MNYLEDQKEEIINKINCYHCKKSSTPSSTWVDDKQLLLYKCDQW